MKFKCQNFFGILQRKISKLKEIRMLEWIYHVRQTHSLQSTSSGKIKKNTTLKKALSASSKYSVVAVLERTVGTTASEL